VLISMSPVFAKLRNPILRKTVARVATIQQISVVGSIPVEQIINRLRRETGQDELQVGEEETGQPREEAPVWFSETRISARFDASPVINSGGSPMAEVLRLANSLGKDQILELRTPFVPAPILDMLSEKGFKYWSARRSGDVISYISPA
jgi:hypothetical protein